MKILKHLTKKGFSLIELMIVVGIIGLLSVIAIPQYQKAKRKAMQSEARTNLSILYTMQRTFIVSHGWGTANFSQLGFYPKGTFHYTVGWGAGQRVGLHNNIYVLMNDKAGKQRLRAMAPPYNGPLAKNQKSNLWNACKSKERPNRPDSNCFLVLGRRKSLGPPTNIPKEKSGLPEDRFVRIENKGYRNVKFLIGARNRYHDIWIITENMKMINTHSGL